MTNPEVEFGRELEVLRIEAEKAIQFFYAWNTIHLVAREDRHIFNLLNCTPLWWNTALGALQTASSIALGRVFDQDRRTHNVDRLLRIAQANLRIFSKAALADRKRREAENADEWLDDYLRDVYVPTSDDFKCLQRHVADRRSIYKRHYLPLRNRVFAHKERINDKALFAKTHIRELQQLLIFLSRLYEALWHLFYNGRKPTLRPSRYSASRMRKRPSPSRRGAGVQERIIRETEALLKSLVCERQRQAL